MNEGALWLIAELNNRISQMELHLYHIKPIVEQVTEIMGGSGSKNSIPLVRNKSTKTVNSIAQDNSFDNWINSFSLTQESMAGGFTKNEIENELFILPRNGTFKRRGTLITVKDRDRVFQESEMKNKPKPIWSRIANAKQENQDLKHNSHQLPSNHSNNSIALENLNSSFNSISSFDKSFYSFSSLEVSNPEHQTPRFRKKSVFKTVTNHLKSPRKHSIMNSLSQSFNLTRAASASSSNVISLVPEMLQSQSQLKNYNLDSHSPKSKRISVVAPVPKGIAHSEKLSRSNTTASGYSSALRSEIIRDDNEIESETFEKIESEKSESVSSTRATAGTSSPSVVSENPKTAESIVNINITHNQPQSNTQPHYPNIQANAEIILLPTHESKKPPEIKHSNSIKNFMGDISAAFLSVARTAKYDTKGSLLSVHNLQTGDSKINFDKAVQKGLTGFNQFSSFNVSVDFCMAGQYNAVKKYLITPPVIYISLLWIAPLNIGFGISIHWSYNVFLSVAFFFDTIIESFTPRITDGAMSLIKNPTLSDWQRHYFLNNFIIDMISAVPFELFPISGSFYLIVIRFLRIYKLPHIMAVSPKFIALRKFFESALGIGQTFSGIFPLMFALCLFLHIESCALFLVGTLADFSNSGIAQVQFKRIGDQYTWALFNVCAFFSTKNYVELFFFVIQAVGNTFPMTYKPISTLEQLTVLVFIIVGAGLYASIVGTISSFAMGLDASGRLYKQKMDELHEYMHWKDINPTTKRKVIKYYEIKYRGKFFEEKTLLGEMNESLRMEISAHNCRELIQKVPFLRREMEDGRDELFLGRIATSLTACFFVAGDIIFTQGEIGYDMYFILSGTVEIIVNGNRVAQFRDEVALIANIPRTATVQAYSSCSLYRLTRPDFMSILAEFTDVRERINVIYNERMAKVKLEEQARKNANTFC
ncbi:anaphase-promoting complex subunit Hcn1 [Physocladia obscura]|uniref:Anaphase-promoting complex subunit Hcn1 n=1 Tax=Physocladia obscura TaxID=109957 RepID=A0AAD5T4P8_9FUNG|nr:anaphase-promoting complex subunit Hcn1 [Physocladia obscura]